MPLEKIQSLVSVDDFFELSNVAGLCLSVLNIGSDRVYMNVPMRNVIEENEWEMSLPDWLTFLHKKDRLTLNDALTQVRAGEPRELRLRIVRRDQSLAWAKCHLVYLSSRFVACLFEVLSTEDVHTKWIGSSNQQLEMADFLPEEKTFQLDIHNLIPNLQTFKTSKTEKNDISHIFPRFSDVLENIPYGLAIINKDWELVYVNAAFERIFECSISHLYSQQLWKIYSAQNYYAYYIHLSEAMSEQKVVKFRDYLHQLRKIVDVSAYPNEEGMTVFVQDVTAVQSYVEALEDAEERFSLLASNIKDVFWIADADFEAFEYVSPSYHEFFNLTPYQSVSQKDEWLSIIHKDDVDYVLEGFRKMKYRRAVIEFRIITKDDTIKWIRTRGFPVFNERHDMIVGVHEDITQLKEREEWKQKEKQLETVAHLAAGIAHEIKNPLTSIKGFLQIMLSEEQRQNKYSDIVFNELERIEDIVNEFMMLAKPEREKQMVRTSLPEIVDYTTSLFKKQIEEKSITLNTSYSDGTFQVLSEPKRLKQVFINLIKNALEASTVYGTLTIEGEEKDDLLFVRVRDSGKGIDAETLKRIGEPFFTTKEKGTGLGIVVTKKLVHDLGGDLTFDSEKGKGTTVTVTLPKSK
ncbi:ATP-binding protein [Pontibacillus halophilus]|nr:ATP-binding protein [Pontibacillus halophilus]